MKVARKRKRKVEIPNASMSDIAFLLIIFFMSTTQFDIQEGVEVRLTNTETTEQKQQQELKLGADRMTRIEIMNDGSISINNESPRNFSDEELDGLILQKIEARERAMATSTDPKEKDLPMLFLLKTNTEAKYSYMVRVVDLLVTYKERAWISISTEV